MASCTICEKKRIARGWCWQHYRRWMRTGTTDPRPRVIRRVRPTRLQRLFDKIAIVGDCWEWQASRFPTGYGSVSWNGKHDYAHRVVYRVTRGDIPHGLNIDHLLCAAGRC